MLNHVTNIIYVHTHTLFFEFIYG